MANVGYATLTIIPSARGFQSALAGQVTPAMAATGTASGRTMGKKSRLAFLGSFKGVGAALAGVFAAQKITQGIGSVIGAASDLGESVNAVQVVFGDAAKGVLDIGDNAAQSMGLSKTEFLGLGVQFSNFAATVAGPGGDVASTLEVLTLRAADFASVMNVDVADAAGLFQSGLAGETEPLRKYGIDLSAAAVEAHALATGIVDSKGKMTEAQKVTSRYDLLMQQTAKTHGDFANTSDSLANRQRILGARFGDIKATLGQGLLPVAESALGVFGGLLDKFAPLASQMAGPLAGGITAVVEGFSSLGAEGGVGAAVAAFVGGLLPVFQGLWESLTTTIVPAFAEIVAVVNDHLVPAFKAFLPAFQPVAAFIIQTIGGAVIGALQGAMTFIKGALKIVSGIFTFFTGLLTGDWSKAWDGIKQTVSGVIDAIKGAIQVWWNLGILKTFRVALGSLRALWSGGLNAIKGAASGALTFVKNLVGRILGGIGGLFRTSFNFYKGIVSTVFNTIKTLFTKGLQAAFDLVRNKFGAIVSTIKTKVGDILGVVKGIPGKVKDALSGAKDWLLSAGKDAIRGFISGLKSMAGNVISAVRDTITDKLPGFVKKALGIQSPSKVFAELGGYVSEGFAVGIMKGGDHVKGAAENLSSLLVKAFDSRAAEREKLVGKLEGLGRRVANLVDRQAKAKGATANKIERDLAAARREVLAITAAIVDLDSMPPVLTSATELDKAMAGIAASSSKLEGLDVTRQAILTKITTANEELAAAIKVRDDFAANVSSKSVNFASLLGFDSASLAEGEKTTAADLQTFMQNRYIDILEFKNTIGTLAASGLNAETYRQLVEAGVEGGSGFAEALAEGGPLAVKQINILQGKIDRVSDTLGKESSGYLYQAGVDTMDGLLAGLESKESALRAQMREIAALIVETTTAALGIASPSKVFMRLGGHVAEGFALGIAGGAAEAQVAMGNLAKPPSTPAMSASVANAPTSYSPSGGVLDSFDGLRSEIAGVRTEIRRQTDRSMQLTRTGAR